MASNKNLHIANKEKKDEFYTQLNDIENELKHYKSQFKDKVIFCNCDDPYESNFFKYFAMNFNFLGLKKLIATCYDSSPIAYTQIGLFEDGKPIKNNNRHAYKIEITEVKDFTGNGATDLSDVKYLLQNGKNTMRLLNGDGDFRSEECIELLKQADMVVTNPPFSLFREYMAQLMKYDKQFLIMGNQNNLTYKDIFPLISKNKLWLGYNNGAYTFQVPMSYERNNSFIKDGVKYAKFGNICWYTNLETIKRNEELILYKKYNPAEYPKYDNYDAINVDKVSDIPCDYDGVMGVPITFIDKYNPNQFEIVAFRKGNDGKDLVYSFTDKNGNGGGTTILQNSCQKKKRMMMSSDQSLQGKRNTEEFVFATSIPGLIKNAEGKINNKITYARITIRRKK